MSYSFYVHLDAPPTYEDALAGAADLETSEGPADELAGPWKDGHLLAVWQHGVSTRPIELAWERGAFSARILACSCAEDYAIALDVVCAVADQAGVEIESEEGVTFAPKDREEHYGRAWIEPHVRSMVTMIAAGVGSPEERDQVATMPGPTRDFHIGPRVRSELAAIDDHDALADALFAKMRAVFYPDEERYYGATIMGLRLDDGAEITVTALGPGVGYVLPPVEYLAIIDEPPFEIPFAALPELLGEDAITWIDDETPRFEAIDGAAWDDFVARARERAVDLGLHGDGPAPSSGGFAPDRARSADDGARFPLGLVIGLLLALLFAVWLILR